ncbi:MAG: BTAD domain-containing putative transcriptional regulator [Acidimicrobiia bacterium]|nr:BTAD domain-containing putative transcriptional regulator [Acidimicrobiia bacterium]
MAGAVRGAERALGLGDAQRAHELVDAALGAWRGDPYEELDHLEEVVADRHRLAELVIAAENLRLRAALALGRVAWAVPEAERLVAISPYDEGRWALLMGALDLAGRRGDALGAFDRARRRLREEFGIDPGPTLRAAEAAVLGGDHEDGRLDEPHLVGRDAELEALARAVDAGGLVLVEAEEGAGSSALLASVARRARAAGAAVSGVRCSAHPATATVTLVDLLQGLGEEAERARGPEDGFVAAVARAASRRRVVLAVDDLHLAGPTTQRALEACADLDGVTVVATVSADHEVDGSRWPTVLALGPLDRSAVEQLVRDVLGPPAGAADELIDWLAAMSGGNPLFLRSLLADREVADRWAGRVAPDGGGGDADVVGPDPAGLRDLVRRRIARLGAATRAGIEVAAVCGPELPTGVLERLVPPVGVQAAHASGLLVADDTTTWFRHGAVQRVVHDDVPPGRRMEIHHAAAGVLREQGHPAALVAPHLLDAVELDPGAATRAAREAAEDASNQGAHREAARWYREAVEAARSLGPEGAHEVIVSLIGLGDALRLAGVPGHEEVLFEAADLAVSADAPDLVAEAAFALLQLGSTTESGAPHERAVALAERTLATTTDPERRAVVAAAGSLAQSMSGDPERCRSLFLEAERLATSDEVRRKVLPFTFLGLGLPGDLDDRERLGRELLARAEAVDDAVGQFEGRHVLFSVGLQRADGDGVRAALDAMTGLVDRVGDVGRRWAIGYQAAAVAHLDDDLERSERLAEEAMALFSPVSPSRAFAVYGAQLLVVRLAQGRIGELAEVTAGLVADQPAVPAWHAALALAVADTEPARAAEHAAATLERATVDFTWLAAHVIGGRAAARVGDRELAARYAERLEPYAGLVCWQGTCAYGPVDTVLAALAVARGDRGTAAVHADGARALARSLGAAVFEREVDELPGSR